jgi:hypothetical protein
VPIHTWCFMPCICAIETGPSVSTGVATLHMRATLGDPTMTFNIIAMLNCKSLLKSQMAMDL